MSATSKTKPAFKVWLETDEGYVFGPGVYRLLRRVDEMGTLKDAAAFLGMSYRFAWGLIRKAEEKLGQPLIHAHKGGRSGGGGAELTEVGFWFLDEFSKIERAIKEYSKFPIISSWFTNELTGEVIKVRPEGSEAQLTLRLRTPAQIEVIAPESVLDAGDVVVGNRFRLRLRSALTKVEKVQ
jgi:molybdate transport system regulatory protein